MGCASSRNAAVGCHKSQGLEYDFVCVGFLGGEEFFQIDALEVQQH